MANENRYYKKPFAQNGNKSEVPDESVSGAVSYDTGYGSDYELPEGSVNRKRIERQPFNGMMNSITKNLKQWQENLYPTWIEDNGDGVAFSYNEGMIVSHSGVDYISLEDNNQEEPGSGDKWVIHTQDSNYYNNRKTVGLVSDKSNLSKILSVIDRKEGKIVWVGDSITEQGKTGTGNGVGFTTFLEDLFPNATYVNEGIGGNTTIDIINRLTSIKSNAGNLYVVAIGVNDIRYNDARGATTVAAYIANIQAIYDSLSATGADVAFIGVWPTFWEDQFAALLRAETDNRMTQYNAALRDFCRENDLVFSDPNPAIRSVVDFANVQTLIPDGVHPDYTETIGKKLYADSVLIDNVRREDYSDNVYANGKVFFKFVFGDNGATDGFLGLKNIAINGTSYQEAFGDTANLGFLFDADLYGTYKPAFDGFYNKAHDYPLTTTVGVDSWPDSIVLSSMITETAGNRGARPFEVWFSTNPESVTDVEHDSWVLYEKHTGEDGVAVNILPKSRSRFYYQLRLTSGTTVDLKQIATRYPVKVATQNVVATSEQRFDMLFGEGADVVANALSVTAPNGLVMWESDGEENEFTLASFSSTLGDFTIYQSTDPDALSDVVHESWVSVVEGSGDGDYVVPRMRPAEYVADSVAIDVAGIRAALNETLNQLRLAGVMKSS